MNNLLNPLIPLETNQHILPPNPSAAERADIPAASLRAPANREILPGILSCGSKHDALVHARIALGEGPALVPAFFGITDAQIVKLFSSKTIDLWNRFAQLGRSQPCFSGELWDRLEIKSLLIELRLSIKQDILSTDLPLSIEQKEMLTTWADRKKLIVRSSSNEDTMVVNAGGNKSLGGISPNEESLKIALAEVVASYFRFVSLKNRSPFENPFAELPLCSVLVMEQIDDEGNETPIISGVMLTHKPSWMPQEELQMPHITASWGPSAGTSCAIPCDEWVLTPDMIYSTIRRKNHRFAILPGGERRQTPNPPSIREVPALSGAQLALLHATGQKLEAYFKTATNIEFVIQGEQLYIVQARPIQESEMTSPTFLDPDKIPAAIPYFSCKTIVSGTSRVLSLEKQNILLSSSLEQADRSYIPAVHRAVIIHTPPECSNSHAEVNFSSQKPPVPCLVLPEDNWKTCKQIMEPEFGEAPPTLQICPQTGLVLIVRAFIPVSKGLFVHPAHLLVSISDGINMQGSSMYAPIGRIRELLIATPERLAAHLPKIEQELAHVFTEIFARKIPTRQLEHTAKCIHQYSMQVFGEMQKAAAAGYPTLLSFHARMLRQVLEQTGTQVVGGHSLSGLESATYLPAPIAAFIADHEQSEVLCALAMLGKKAFDAPRQEQWIAFLRSQVQSIPEEQWLKLLEQMRELDELDLLALWFSIHLSIEMPNMESLLTQDAEAKEFLVTCRNFECRLDHLAEATAHISTIVELNNAWEALRQETDAFLPFCAQHRKRNLLQNLQLSKVLYNLVQLWDLNIKTVRTSQLLSEQETNQLFTQRIDAFAGFAKIAGARGILSIRGEHLSQFQSLMQSMIGQKRQFSGSHPFSVIHWIVPESRTGTPITSDDERLTVIHQNLVRVSGPLVSKEMINLLPLSLATAVKIFQKKNPIQAKRFAEDHGMFISILNESASVTINIPLNFHSFVITMKQDKGSDKIDFISYWKEYDNNRYDHIIDFLQIFSAMTGITLKNHDNSNRDSKLVFSAEGEKQFTLLSQAISTVNAATLSAALKLKQLVWILHPEKISVKSDQFEIQTEQTKNSIFEYAWQRFKEIEKMPTFFEIEYNSLFIEYLQQKGYSREIWDRVIEEVEGFRPNSMYRTLFFEWTIESLPPQEQRDLFWRMMTKTDVASWKFYQLPDHLQQEMIERLCREAPMIALSYCLVNEDNKIRSFAKNWIMSEEPKSLEQRELLEFVLSDEQPSSDECRRIVDCLISEPNHAFERALTYLDQLPDTRKKHTILQWTIKHLVRSNNLSRALELANRITDEAERNEILRSTTL